MKHTNSFAPGILIAMQSLVAACHCTKPLADPPLVGGEIELFDGSTLDGWTQRGGAATYRVEDGCIVGRTAPNQPNSFLCTTSEYADFVLWLEFKIDDELNSGIQIRSKSTPAYQDGRVHGYQVEIDPSERAWTGGIYEEGRRGWLDDLADNPDARAAFKHNDWNTLKVEARGDHMRTWINGVPAGDLHDSMTPSGFIALQVHGVGERVDPLEVRWRNIRLWTVRAPPSHAGHDPVPAPPASR